MIKNQELAQQILEMINTAIEATEQMLLFIKNDQIAEFNTIGEELFILIRSIRSVADSLKAEEEGLNLPEASQSVMVSLARILGYAKEDSNRAGHKTEFELLPLIEEMRVNFYYWGMVYPDGEKMRRYYEHDVHWLAGNRYTKEAERTGSYKYDLSIFVLAYNKIEYTKLCLKHLYENLPTNLKYEIILINHGSNDGTKELFETYRPEKQLDISVNGGGFSSVFRITEGKYIAMVSNDVIVTKNAIDNLYQCITHADNAAWVVPTTPNISNLQAIPAKYDNLFEMQEFAEKNNVSDCYRWEQRVRLCNPMEIIRADFVEKTKVHHIYHSKNRMSFPDDKKSLVCRRNGYKMYLAKDAYCYHFGQVTLKEDVKTNSALAFQTGREDFIRAFGIDPWGQGFCYAIKLITKLKCENKKETRILGIECGLGANPLKIKEQIKENVHNSKVHIKNVTTSKRLYQDLCGVSDQVVLVTSHNEILKIKEKFDYIVNETLLEKEEELVRELEIGRAVIAKEGIIILLVGNELKERLLQKPEAYSYLSDSTISNNESYSRYPAGSAWVILSNYREENKI